MRSPAARYLALVTLCTQLSCGLFGIGRSTTPHPANAAGVHTYTDSDPVTAVASTPTDVFVGTARGVLRYPTAGGAPVRATRADGLPDDRVTAMAAGSDGTSVWAATPHGVARFDGAHWSVAGDPNAQPSVGTPTAMLALGGNSVLLGGTQGLARFDGTRWTKLSDRLQVVSIASDQGRPLIATAQSGVVALRGDLASLDVYDTQAGIPETMVRNVVPVGSGRFWALVQSANGAKLAYFDGQHFIGYTSERVRDPWLALVPNADHTGASLLVPGGMYDITQRRGEELIATEVGPAGGAHRLDLHPEPIEPPPPPPPPPELPPEPPPPVRGHGHGAHLAAGHPAATAGHPAATAPAIHPAHPTPVAPVTHAHAAGDGGTTLASATDAGVPADHVDLPTAATTTAIAAATTTRGADGGVAPRPVPALRAIAVPAPSGPVDVPHGGPTLEAPTFGLERNTRVSVADDVTGAFIDASSGVYVARVALGVTRVAGGAVTDFREHDLALRELPLSLAADSSGAMWFVADDNSAIRYDGSRFAHATIDNDPAVVPLMFFSHGTTSAAVARVGNNVLRTYRWQGRGWTAITERPIDTRGPGALRARFLAVDSAGRYWVGVRVVRPAGQGGAVDLGVAVIDEQHPAATQFNSQVAPTGGEQGAKPAPDDLTSVAFDAQGTAWFAGLSGATSIALPPSGGDATVHTYNEANGLRGDVVSDLVRGPGDRIFIAGTEGLGYWDGAHWAFDLPGSGTAPHVIGLAEDNSGGLWGAGTHGAWVFDGSHFRTVGHGDGLPTDTFTDVAVDGEDRVWFVTDEGVSIVPAQHVAPGASTGGGT